MSRDSHDELGEVDDDENLEIRSVPTSYAETREVSSFSGGQYRRWEYPAHLLDVSDFNDSSDDTLDSATLSRW